MYHIPARLTRRVGIAVLAMLRDPFGLLLGALQAERARFFYFAPVLFGAGIAFYFALPFEPPIGAVLAAAGFSLFAFAMLRHTVLRPACMALLLASCGLSLATLQTERVRAPILPAQVGPAQLEGLVRKVERRPNALRLVIRPESFGGLRTQDLPSTLRISVRSMDGPVQPGDRIRVLASAQPPSSPAEPGAFDFQRYAFYRGIGGYGFALGSAEVLSTNPAEARFSRFRDRLAARIADVMGMPSGGIAAALITGDRSRITEEQQQALRDSGLAHLLAISGLHMGLVTGFLFFGLRAGLALFPGVALRWPIKKWAAVAALSGGFGYLVLTGGSVTTVRAYVMVALVMLAVLVDRRAISLRTVAIAALLVLAITPEALVEPGFQMSFAAVTALVALYERFGESWRVGVGQGGLPRRIVRYLVGVGVTTLIAGAATGPFAIYHFGRFADYGILGNLAAIPLVAFWVMPWATVGALLMPLGLEGVPLWMMGQGIEGVMAIAYAVADLPGAVRLVPAMPLWGLIAVTLGGLWLCLMSRGWRYWGLAVVALGLLSPHIAERPLVRVDADGRILAVRTASGGTMLSSTRREKFTARQWLARDGVAAGTAWPAAGVSADGRLRCDSAGCILRVEGWMIALPAGPAALQEDCRRADVVISLEPVRGRCPSARYVIDRFDLWRDGAHALWLDPQSGPSIRSADGVRGTRPWTPDPVPRKDQYWRKSAASRP
ncbi:ComEC/Rec2 family competence protein [Minwuia sp.]|uniref:ComEC/Rec2 family competence protein n=1 Tax=Minwuia sp. TaxID=2493630 RepID=UPI003A8FF842